MNSPVTDLHRLRANSEKHAPWSWDGGINNSMPVHLTESKVLHRQELWALGWGGRSNVLNAFCTPRWCRCTFPSVESPYLMLSSLLPRGKNTKGAGWVRSPCGPCSSSLSSQPLWVTPSFKSSRWSPYSPGTILVGTILQCQDRRPLYTICKL